MGWRTVGSRNEQERDRWVVAALQQIDSGERILDAGAGEQRYRHACSHLVYVAQDFAQYDPSEAAVGLAEPKWDYGLLDIVSDITSIPAPSGSFDAVLCTEVLEHVPDSLATLRELSRLLRPGGELILTAPFASLTHQAPFHFATGFSRFYFEHHLPLLGFEIVELTPNGDYFELLAQELRRLRFAAKRYSTKTVRWLDLLAVVRLLATLARLERSGGRSSELAVLGWHVRARRQ